MMPLSNNVFNVAQGSGMRPEVPRILIVEDEAIVAEDLSDQLSAMGYAICGIADNGLQAVSMAEEFCPDIVMMDVVIKGPMDGIAAAEIIRRKVRCPVIFATAYSDPDTLSRAALTAPYGYLTKPYQARDARAAIEVALYKSLLERKLKDSEQWFSATLRCIADAVIAVNVEGKIQFANPSAEHLLQRAAESMLGERALDVIRLHGEKPDINPLSGTFRDEIKAEAKIFFGQKLSIGNDIETCVDVAVALIRSAEETVVGAVIAMRDVSERIKAENELKESEERFRSAFEFAPVGMVLVTMEGQILQCNEALATLTGYTLEECYTLPMSVLAAHDDKVSELELLNSLLISDIPCVQFDKRLLHRSGKVVDAHATVSLLRRHGEPVCYLYQIYDMTERKRYEESIVRLAHYDSLTGLANRARLFEEIDRQIVAARRSGSGFALLFCDLDHFKNVNDSMGHEAGDKLLQAAAECLQGAVRESDFVARLGGDEFVLLLNNVGTPTGVVRTIEKIKAALNSPLMIEEKEIRIGGSFGVAMFPADGGDAKSLLRNADSALYDAKGAGRNGFAFYRDEISRKVEEQLLLATELRNALDRDEFELHFQPIVDLGSNRVCVLEALIRWNHPERGLVGPGVFLPYAEESGLMPLIGEWVIHDACRACAEWSRRWGPDVAVGINVSRSQFYGKSIVRHLQEALHAQELDPRLVNLELTEQLLISDTEQNINTVAELRELGVGIALDDFGVGYSSLSYVARFSPQKIKIDQSFIQNLGGGGYNDALIESILALGERLDVKTVAEGVETVEQLERLRALGCRYVQGYYFARPMPESALEDFVVSSKFV